MIRFARPYAKALLAVAGTTERAVMVRDQLAGFDATQREVPALAAMVTNPALPLATKRQALERVAERLALDPLTGRVLLALLSRHRLGSLDQVVAALTDALNRQQGIAVAEVQTAEPLDGDEQQQLQRVLEAKVGKKLEMRLAVDPSLLAGFVARIDSQLYDGSLRGQLDRLAKELAEA